MTDRSQSTSVEGWRTALGLLPVPLRDTAESTEQYVLMNGSTGNFCLDFHGSSDATARRASAWSCDVGHYVTCDGDIVIVSPARKELPEERYSLPSVWGKLHEFHRHLEKTAPERSRRIVSHVLRVLRRLRAVLPGQDSGPRSLRVLLHLIATAASGRDRLLDETSLHHWGLPAETFESTRMLNEATWRPIYNDLCGTGRYDILPPDFQLVLRHATGAIFEDAHLEAIHDPQQWFPGFEQPVRVGTRAVPKDTGVYFTPPALARTVAEEAISSASQIAGDAYLSIFDPACGSGELLKECLRLLKLRGYSSSVHVIGWDTSPAAIDTARFVLAWEKRSWLPDQLRIDIQRKDSLQAAEWPNGVHLIVTNPPFKSWQLMSDEEQHRVCHIVGSTGKPNLAMAFAMLAIRHLGPTGVLAMIAPGSLLEAASGKETRRAMADALTAQLVAHLGDQTIFARALVDTSIFVGKRKPSHVPPTAVVWADSTSPQSFSEALKALRRWRGAEAEPIIGDGFSVYRDAGVAASEAPWIARSYESWRRYQALRDSPMMQPANQIVDIRQGIRLGSDVFIVRKEYVRHLPKNERRFFRPAVMNPSILDGQLRDTHYAFYPYTAGLPAINTESDLKEHVPQYFLEYLYPAKSALMSRKTLARQPELHWWDLLRSRGWQKEPGQKLVSKYFGGRRSFALDPSGDFVVVVGHAWILKSGLGVVEFDDDEARALGIDEDEEPEFVLTDEERYTALLAYLNSSIAYDLIEYFSVQVSGGQLDLSNKYVGRLPVPRFSQLLPGDLSELVQAGRAIIAEEVEDWKLQVDSVVCDIVGDRCE